MGRLGRRMMGIKFKLAQQVDIVTLRANPSAKALGNIAHQDVEDGVRQRRTRSRPSMGLGHG